MSDALANKALTIVSYVLLFFATLIVSSISLVTYLTTQDMAFAYFFYGISAVCWYFGAKFLILLYALKDSFYLFIPQLNEITIKQLSLLRYTQLEQEQMQPIKIKDGDTHSIRVCKLYASGISPMHINGKITAVDRINYYRDLRKGVRILLMEHEGGESKPQVQPQSQR